MDNTPDILKKIITHKHKEIEKCQQQNSINTVMEKAYACQKTRGFYQTIKSKTNLKQNAVIAEIKKASPSKGIFRQDFNPVSIAKSYEKGGATCLSVLTDKNFFQGDSQYLIDVKKVVSIPILRKEFIIHPYQVFESKAIGADCILLIVACLNDKQLEELFMLAISLQMEVLIEVHNETELKRAQQLKPLMIGINNRNLNTFKVTLQTTINLIKKIKDDVLVITESGITNSADVTLMRTHNIYSYLIGEVFMRQKNPGQALKEMFE